MSNPIELYFLPPTSIPPNPVYPSSLSRIHQSVKPQSLSSLLLKTHLVPSHTLTLKPHLKPIHPSYVFNVSHDNNIVALARLSSASGLVIGLDISHINPPKAHSGTIPEYVNLFSSQIPLKERTWIGSDLSRFHYVWTCRESFFKMLGYGLLGDLLSHDFEFTEILVPPQVTFGGDEVKCRFFFEGSVLKEYYVVICIASSELAEPTFKESLPLIDSVELERSVIIKRLTFTDIESTYNKINDQSPPPSSLVLYDPTQKKIDTLKLETYSLSLTPDVTLTLEQRYLPDKKGGTDLGFGASVYPCSVVLSLYIYDHIYEGSFLELGSGPGLISCVCKVKGFRGWCTDGDSGSCELSQINLNKLEEGEEVIVEKYLWGEEIDKYVEYVFMSDVVARPYVEDLPKLINTLKELFKINPELKVLFSYKNRGGGEEDFWRMAGEWKVERVEEYWIRSEWRKEGIEVWRITTK